MKKTFGDLEFNVTNNNNPLGDAMIAFANDTLVTNIYGMAFYKYLSLDSAYNYHLWKPGYQPIWDTLIFIADTTLTIEMTDATTAKTRINEITKPYPVPATNHITLNLPDQVNRISLIDLKGIVISKHLITSKTHQLDITHLDAGYYFIISDPPGAFNPLPFVKE